MARDNQYADAFQWFDITIQYSVMNQEIDSSQNHSCNKDVLHDDEMGVSSHFVVSNAGIMGGEPTSRKGCKTVAYTIKGIHSC